MSQSKHSGNLKTKAVAPAAEAVDPLFAAAALSFFGRVQLNGTEVRAYVVVLDTLAAIEAGRLKIVAVDASLPLGAAPVDVVSVAS